MRSVHSRAARYRALGVGLGLLVLCSLLGPGLALAASDRLSELQKTLRASKNTAQRRQAAEELGKLGEEAAVPQLVQSLLADRSDAVRAACAEALGQLGEVGARAALRAASHDESERVQRLASAALEKLEEKQATLSRPLQRVSVIVGRMGSKAKSGTLSDIPKRLRETILKELQAIPELDLFEENKKPTGPNKIFLVESSVTNLARRTTPSGELEISCDISVVIALMPGHNIVGIVSGGASAFGPRGPSTKPTKALLENLETQALTQAVQSANENLVSFLRAQTRAPSQ
ncbi:MAG TPA: HEAT repeat domain-containing protein [Pseudomonadota bacterium]|nr:HEAT repeat domain-containing protein [Pseudomonadota bacterium]